jgi:hypothetical protein
MTIQYKTTFRDVMALSFLVGLLLLFGVAVDQNGRAATATEPRLTIDRAGSTVVIGWPASSPGTHLEFRRQHPGTWAPVSSKPRLVDGRFQLITGCTEVGEFYRVVCDPPESCGCIEDPLPSLAHARSTQARRSAGSLVNACSPVAGSIHLGLRPRE